MPGDPASLICGITQNSSSAPLYTQGVGQPLYTKVNAVHRGSNLIPVFVLTEGLILTSLGHGNQDPTIMIRMRH